MLAYCPTCTCLHYGPAEHCGRCRNRMSPADAKRSYTVFSMLSATRAQREAARSIFEAMDHLHLVHEALNCFDQLSVDMRTAFFDHHRIHGDAVVNAGPGCE